MHRLKLRAVSLLPHHFALIEVVAIVLAAITLSTGQAYAAYSRLPQRSMYIGSSLPGAITDYTISFTYNTVATVGSVDIKFCIDPIPYLPCDVPPGFDVSQASLTSQTGETGYSLNILSPNHVVLTRSPTVANRTPSSYVLHNVKNPTYTAHSFSARLATYASTDASGPLIDLGSVIQQAVDPIIIQTQVPPILIFCMAEQVTARCDAVSTNHYTDMGTLGPEETLTAITQMGVGTNASDGYVITVNGTSLQAGTHVLRPLAAPTPSFKGQQQFGLNLRANDDPEVGQDPDGPSINGQPTTDYDSPNLFKFKDGDIVASAPNVSLIRRYTSSYIANAPIDLHAGVYTTTITYVCSGRF